jgi:hypothetical protein
MHWQKQETYINFGSEIAWKEAHYEKGLKRNNLGKYKMD